MSFYDDASLIMYPSGYKADKIYSLKPTDGSGDLDFTRSNDTATRVNSDGLIEKVRTNLFLQSETFSNASWTKTNATFSADTLTADAGTNFKGIVQNEITNGLQNVYFDVAYTNHAFLQIGFGTNASDLGFSNYDIQNKTLGLSSGIVNNSIQDFGTYVRISLSINTTSKNSVFLIFANSASDSRAPSYTGTGSFKLFRSQLETGDIETDYIPTTTAAASVGMLADIPRIDYTGGGCGKLLLEGQRTNSVTFSEQFDNAAWTKSADVTLIENYGTSPDGYQNADRAVANASTGGHIVFRAISTTGTHTISIFAKASGYNYTFLGYDGGSLNFGIVFNLSNGTISQNPAGLTGTIEAVGSDGWYRCTLTYNYAIAAYFVVAPHDNSGDYNWTGNGTDGILIWGAQAEFSASYATSYIPTLSAASTRGADFGSASNMIGTSYASSDFSYFIEFNLLEDSGTSNNPMVFGGGNAALGSSYQGYLRIGLSGNNTMSLFGHGDSIMASVVYAFTKATRYKLLVKRSGTSIKFYVNGAQVGATGTSSLDFTLRSIGWSYAANTYSSYGNIYQFLGFENALTDTQAIELTTL